VPLLAGRDVATAAGRPELADTILADRAEQNAWGGAGRRKRARPVGRSRACSVSAWACGQLYCAQAKLIDQERQEQGDEAREALPWCRQ